MDNVDLLFLLGEARVRPFAGRAIVFSPDSGADLDGRIDALCRRAGMADLPRHGDIWRRFGFGDVIGGLALESAGTFGLEAVNLPDHLLGSFDVAIDLGESTRRFHMPNAMANLCRLVRSGGRIVHAVPSCNHVDRAFYMMSPTYYQDFYTANGFALEAIQIARCPPSGPVEFLAYRPGELRPIAHGGLDRGPYRLFCVARKQGHSTADAFPQQGLYVRAWAEPRRQTAPGLSVAAPVRPTARSRLADALRRNRAIYRLIYLVLTPRKRRRLIGQCMPVVARYDVTPE